MMKLDYFLQETTLPNEEGTRKLYPKIRLSQNIPYETFLWEIDRRGHVTGNEARNVLANVAETLLEMFQMGRSVKIDGLGTFKIALGMEDGLPAQTVKGKGERYDTKHVCVKDVQFIVDKQWLNDIRGSIRLRKYGKADEIKPLRQIRTTREERYQMALDHLKLSPFLRVKDYAAMTGLPHSTACKEIRELSEMPDSGIKGVGRGNQKMYMKR